MAQRSKAYRAAAEKIEAGKFYAPAEAVALANDSDFGPLREQRLVFEYFPFTLDASAPPPEPRWAAYFQAVLELTMRRWGVRQVVLL